MKNISWILLCMLLTANLNAQTAWLVIPSHYWSDGVWRPTDVIQFKDVEQMTYPGQKQCELAKQALLNSDPTPSLSFCQVKPPDPWIWQ